VKYRVKIEHHEDCPFGTSGLRAYWEARDAFSSTPPEARVTEEDRVALAKAERELEEKQVCRCGVPEVTA
jgi:hypothetical protein